MAKVKSLSKKYADLKNDHEILLGEAKKAGIIMHTQNRLLEKYKLLVETKDETITRLNQEIEQLKEGCCCGNCKNESAVRDGANAGGGLSDLSVHGNEETSCPEEPGQSSSEESGGDVRVSSAD